MHPAHYFYLIADAVQSSDAAANPVTTTVGSTLLAVGGMQWLKKSKWFPLLQEGQKTLNRTVSAVVAFGVSVGIHFVWNSQQHSLLITGLSLGTIAIGLFHWAEQFIYQETGFTVLSGLQAMQELAKAVNPQAGQAGQVAAPKAPAA